MLISVENRKFRQINLQTEFENDQRENHLNKK